jgi:hypothetical protein
VAEARSERLEVRLTQDEKADLERRAADTDLKLSDYAREQLCPSYREATLAPTPTLDALRQQVGDGITIMDCPEGVDEAAYVQRVKEIRDDGLPWLNASKLAREELLGVREKDGAKKHRVGDEIARRRGAKQLRSPEEKARVLAEFDKARHGDEAA